MSDYWLKPAGRTEQLRSPLNKITHTTSTVDFTQHQTDSSTKQTHDSKSRVDTYGMVHGVQLEVLDIADVLHAGAVCIATQHHGLKHLQQHNAQHSTAANTASAKQSNTDIHICVQRSTVQRPAHEAGTQM